MRIRYFALLAIVALLGSVLAYPMMAHALSALCAPGSQATAGPTCAPTPSPTPTPSFVVGGNNTSTNTVTLAGTTPGDIIIGLMVGLGQPTFQVAWFQEQAFASNGGFDAQTSLRTVSPQDTTTYTFPLTNTGTYAGAAFRGYQTADGSSAAHTGSSTSPTTSAFTTVDSGDVIINIIAWNGAATAITFTGSTGFTTAVNVAGQSGVSFGMAIEYKIGAASGSQSASSGAVLSASTPWIAFAVALAPHP